MFVDVHEQATEEDQTIGAIGLERQDISMYGADVGIRSASVLQCLVECLAPFDRDHSGEAAGNPRPNIRHHYRDPEPCHCAFRREVGAGRFWPPYGNENRPHPSGSRSRPSCTVRGLRT